MKKALFILCATVLVSGCSSAPKAMNVINVVNNQTYISSNSSLIGGVVVGVQGVYTTKYTPVRTKTCVDREVPIYGASRASNVIIGVGAVLGTLVAPGSSSVLVYSGSTIVERVSGETVTEIINPNQNIVGYKKVPECRIEETVVQEQVIGSYTVVVRLGGQDLVFSTPRKYVVGQQVVIDVNRNLL
jgi:hypothetical protein